MTVLWDEIKNISSQKGVVTHVLHRPVTFSSSYVSSMFLENLRPNLVNTQRSSLDLKSVISNVFPQVTECFFSVYHQAVLYSKL